MTYYKILTHDFRSPLQTGEPIWDGKTLTHRLPKVQLDTGPEECSYGWNFVSDLATGLKIAGLWPDGRPSIAVEVEPNGEVISRGNKFRAAEIMFLRQFPEEDIGAAVLEMSAPFGNLAEEMTAEQMQWRQALARPTRDESRIVQHLQQALSVRSLAWSLKQFPNARAAWAARDARDAWAARDARAAWDARVAWDAWDARDARDALVIFYTAKRGWINQSPDHFTVGIRDAYLNGLEIALPIGAQKLGWA